MPNPVTAQPRPWQRPVLIGAVAVLAVSAWGAYAMRPHHTTTPTQSTQTSTTPPAMTAPALTPLPTHPVVGQPVTIVITVTGASASTIDGDVLTRTSTGKVAANGQHVHVTYSPAQIAMGRPADVKTGAVFEVDATITATGADLTASRLTDLTGIITPS